MFKYVKLNGTKCSFVNALAKKSENSILNKNGFFKGL